MKRLLPAVLILCLAASSHLFASGVEIASSKIVAELKKGYSKRTTQDIVLADFVTLNVPQSTFGSYLTESLTEAFKSDASVTVIDQQKVDAILGRHNVAFNAGYDYTGLDALSQEIFASANNTPTAYCFGQIREFGDDIKITVKMIDAITGDPVASSSVTFPSDETTDRLLGKPVRVRKPAKPDTVVVYKDRVIEKPAAASTIEPYTAKTIETYTAKSLDTRPSVQEFKTQGFIVTLKKCYFSGDALVFDFSVLNENDVTKAFELQQCQVIDPNGNAVNVDRLNIGTKNGGSFVRADLVSNAPVKASMIFQGLSPRLTSIRALQLTAAGREFVLRDIVIEKE
ncbi:MAG TPA: hypothetical protein VK470_12030 [Bacteroidota bacterium]|nr:hypothetical protein [Bacteroidota bacterium]